MGFLPPGDTPGAVVVRLYGPGPRSPGICRGRFGVDAVGRCAPDSPHAAIEAVRRELAAYFAGVPTDFAALTLDPRGTPFQLRVWQELRRIPWGQTISYGELARRVGNPKASRAVGQANAVNPIPLIIPCHRVIAADGSLGGYSSGLDRKRWLLRHEGARS